MYLLRRVGEVEALERDVDALLELVEERRGGEAKLGVDGGHVRDLDVVEHFNRAQCLVAPPVEDRLGHILELVLERQVLRDVQAVDGQEETVVQLVVHLRDCLKALGLEVHDELPREDGDRVVGAEQRRR